MKTHKPKLEWWWLIHHGVLAEPLLEPIKNRREFVRAEKLAYEIATRLKWMRKIKHPERLPAKFVQTCADWRKACKNWKKDYGAWQRADTDWRKAFDEHYPAIAALHKQECPGCPFDYENKTLIFPQP